MIFIIGTGRCGTTMLARILNAHTRVCVPHELQLIFGYSGNGPRLYEHFYSGDAKTWKASQFIEKVGHICPHQFNKFFNYEKFFYTRNYPEENLGTLLSDLYSAIAISRGKDLLIEQTPWYGQRLDIMRELFPTAKYIHMIRDGRDVALSFARTPWWHELPLENLERWQVEVSKIADDATLLFCKSEYLEVRYEDFIHDLESQISRVLKFLGLSFESGMLLRENMINYSAYQKTSMATHMSCEFNKWCAQKNDVVFLDNVFGWKRFGYDLFKNMSDQTRATLSRFGYET